MNLPEQEIYSTENRRWTGPRKRFLDNESINTLTRIVPELNDRIINGAALGISHKTAIQQARIATISKNQSWGVLIPVDVITSRYFAEEAQSGWKNHTFIPRGRVKTIEHVKNRAATGSAIVVFYPESGSSTVSFVWD